VEQEELRLPQLSDVETREADESPSLQAAYPQCRKAPGAYVVPAFANNELGVHPGKTLDAMIDKYPVRKKGEAIDPGVVQWVDGVNTALHYRGNPIRRCKMFAQRGCTSRGWRKYGYTGRKWAITPAQVDVSRIPELEAAVDKYDAWCDRMGYPRPDHYIITWYEDGTYSIGWHYDKLPDILEGSLITIVKLGEHARPFAIRRRLFFKESSTFRYVDPTKFPKGSLERKQAEKQKTKQQRAFDKLQAAKDLVIFDELVEPGTAIIMTLQANEFTQHAVLEADAERTGSIVFRSIKTLVAPDDALLPTSIRKPRPPRPPPKSSRKKQRT